MTYFGPGGNALPVSFRDEAFSDALQFASQAHNSPTGKMMAANPVKNRQGAANDQAATLPAINGHTLANALPNESNPINTPPTLSIETEPVPTHPRPPMQDSAFAAPRSTGENSMAPTLSNMALSCTPKAPAVPFPNSDPANRSAPRQPSPHADFSNPAPVQPAPVQSASLSANSEANRADTSLISSPSVAELFGSQPARVDQVRGASDFAASFKSPAGASSLAPFQLEYTDPAGEGPGEFPSTTSVCDSSSEQSIATADTPPLITTPLVTSGNTEPLLRLLVPPAKLTPDGGHPMKETRVPGATATVENEATPLNTSSETSRFGSESLVNPSHDGSSYGISSTMPAGNHLQLSVPTKVELTTNEFGGNAVPPTSNPPQPQVHNPHVDPSLGTPVTTLNGWQAPSGTSPTGYSIAHLHDVQSAPAPDASMASPSGTADAGTPLAVAPAAPNASPQIYPAAGIPAGNKSNSEAPGILPAPAPPAVPQAGPIQSARLLSGPAQSEMRIDLITHTFGNVEVHTLVRENQVGLTIGGDHGDLRSWLAPELPILQSLLKRQDLHVSNMTFLGSDQGSFADGSGSPPSRSPGRWPRTILQPDEMQLEREISPESVIVSGSGRLSVHA